MIIFKNNHERSQAGFGLVEVLIAMLVIATGVLALAKFQSTVIAESRENKAKSEAIAQCTALLQQTRIPLTNDSFDTLLSNINDPGIGSTVTGTVDTYISSLDYDSDNSTATATCSWSGGTIEVSSRISPHSAVAGALYSIPEQGGSSGLGASPTLNAGSSIDISDRIKIYDVNGDVIENITEETATNASTPGSLIMYDHDTSDPANTLVAYIVDASGNTASAAKECSASPAQLFQSYDDGEVIFPSFLDSEKAPNVKALRTHINGDPSDQIRGITLYETAWVDSSGTFTEPTVDVDGNIAYLDSDVEYCIPRVLYNGGVIVSISGTIYSSIKDKPQDVEYLPVSLFTFNTSESGTYCYFNPAATDAQSPYACFVGGNCANGELYSGADSAWKSDFSVCPPYPLSQLTSNDSSVGVGGWRGRVGVLDIVDRGYNVCFWEDVYGDAAEVVRTTARDYFTRNEFNSADSDNYRNQGINQSYECQNFLVMSGANDQKYQSSCVAAAAGVGGVQLAPRSTIRYLNKYPIAPGDSVVENTYEPVLGNNCITPVKLVISGSITSLGDGLIPQVTATDGITTWTCISTENDYTCTVYLSPDLDLAADAGDFIIKGQFGSETSVNCSSYTTSSTVDYDGCDLTIDWNDTDPSSLHTITGNLVSELSNPELGIYYIGSTYDGVAYPCVVTSAGYSCTFPQNDTSAAAEMRITANYDYSIELTGTSDTEIVDNSIKVTLNDLGVSAGPDLTITSTATPVDNFMVSGSITFANSSSQSGVGLSILTGDSDLSCTRYDISDAEIASDDTTTTPVRYSCEIKSGSGVTFGAVNDTCGSGKTLLYISSNTKTTSNKKTLPVTFDTVDANVTGMDITVCK